MKWTLSLVVIAGLDPAIQDNRACATASLDRRVKPGDDTRVVQSDRIPL
jgi:hypothetical protein